VADSPTDTLLGYVKVFLYVENLFIHADCQILVDVRKEEEQVLQALVA